MSGAIDKVLAVDADWLFEVVLAGVAAANRRVTVIGTGSTALAERALIRKTPAGCIYQHIWQRSDPDDLHDHPWDSVSLILECGYWEVTPEGRFWRAPGDITFRRATDRHRVEVDPDHPLPVSLFLTGPEIREWGFHTADGWIAGRDYRGRPRG